MKIHRVTSLEGRKAVLCLQLTILPDDVPADVERGAWWLATEGDEPVAFAGVTPSRQWYDCMYLCRAGVLPGCRGRGLQKRLILVRERYARRTGADWLVSDTTKNPHSANNLAARGFRMFEPTRPWGNRYTLYWTKRL